jgi:hypothetical protein
VPLDLAGEENWRGGFYELSIELGRRGDARLDAPIRACWADPALEGCWASKVVDRSQPRVEPSIESQEGHTELVGIASIPGFGSTLCCSYAFHFESGEDWLEFCLPLGAMEAVDPRALSLWEWSLDAAAIAIPRKRRSAPYLWRKPIDDFLVDIAARVARAAAFELAVIGFEVPTPELERKVLGDPIQPRCDITLLVPDAEGKLVRIANPYEEPPEPSSAA